MSYDNYPHTPRPPEPSIGVADRLRERFPDLLESQNPHPNISRRESGSVEVMFEQYDDTNARTQAIDNTSYVQEDNTKKPVHEGTVVGEKPHPDEVVNGKKAERKSLSRGKKIATALGIVGAATAVGIAGASTSGKDGENTSNQPLANASLLQPDIFPAMGENSENSILEQFTPYSLDCPEFKTVEIDTVVPLYYGINSKVEGSDKTAQIFIAPKDAAKRLGISSEKIRPVDETGWQMPEKPFFTKKEKEEGEWVSRYPQAGMVNENVKLMLCHDSDGAIVINPDEPNTAVVNLAKFSLVATYPERGDPDAPKGLIQQYEPLAFKNPDQDSNSFSSEEKHRFNEFAAPSDNPDTPYDESGQNPLIMNELVYGALESVNEGSCRKYVRVAAREYIVQALRDQAEEQGAPELTVEFINDFGQLPHQAFADAKGGEEMIDNPNVIVDFTDKKYNQAEACTVQTESKE